jgi:hypothetical protein
MSDERELLEGAYRDFNSRKIDAVLERLHPRVIWSNGMEGGFVYGREAVRDYWTRQWSILDPRVEPVNITAHDKSRFVVEVHQVVRDLEGNLIVDTMVHHTYEIRDGLIERMDIE